MLPKINFIGIGVQKSATTSLHKILSQHIDVCLATGSDKDTRFFGSYYDRGYEWYERNVSHCTDERIKGEISTSYFYNSDAPERISLYNKDVKLIVCLRNPVQRIISNHKHEVRAGHITGENLDLAKALHNNPAYLLQSMYATHLKRWYNYFDKKQIHVILFDDLVSNPKLVIANLFAFLEIDHAVDIDLTSKQNESIVPANKNIDSGIKSVGKVLRSIGFGRVIAYGRKVGFNDWLRKKNEASPNEQTYIIRSETLDKLNKQLLPEIEELSAITGISLDHWLESSKF